MGTMTTNSRLIEMLILKIALMSAVPVMQPIIAYLEEGGGVCESH